MQNSLEATLFYNKQSIFRSMQGNSTFLLNKHHFDILNYIGCLHAIGISRSTIIPDENFSASSTMQGFPASNGRLKMATEGR